MIICRRNPEDRLVYHVQVEPVAATGLPVSLCGIECLWDEMYKVGLLSPAYYFCPLCVAKQYPGVNTSPDYVTELEETVRKLCTALDTINHYGKQMNASQDVRMKIDDICHTAKSAALIARNRIWRARK